MLYLAISFFAINRPILAEEEFFFLASENILKSGIPLSLSGLASWHPPLYLYSLAAALKIFGPHIYSARLVGVFSFAVALFLIFKITQLIAKQESNQAYILTAFMASLFYASLPVVIRGSHILDIDNTVLTVAFLLFTFFFLRFRGRGSFYKRELLSLGVLLSLVLLAKITTTLALIFLIILYLALRKQFKDGFIIALAGISCFLFFWFIYCHFSKINILGPFLHLRAQFQSHAVGLQDGGSIIRELLNRLLRITAWLSLPFLFLAALISWEAIKSVWVSKVISERFFLVFLGLVIFCVYLFSGGVYYGFPRYQFPAVSLFVIALSLYCFEDVRKLHFEKGKMILFIGVILFSILAFVFLVGDPVYSVNYKLKEALIYQNLNSKRVLMKIVMQIFVAQFLAFALFYFLLNLNKNRLSIYSKLKLSLIIQLFAASWALNIVQMGAAHAVEYCYGERKTAELIAFLKSDVRFRDRQILAPNDILYNVSSKHSEYRLDRFWNSPGEVLAELVKEDAGCLVYSVPHNTIAQFKNVFLNREIVSVLNARYKKIRIGTYELWIRL